VTGEDVIFSLTQLDFEDYLPYLKIYLAKYRSNLMKEGFSEFRNNKQEEDKGYEEDREDWF
jgi:hypothetical protein